MEQKIIWEACLSMLELRDSMQRTTTDMNCEGFKLTAISLSGHGTSAIMVFTKE